VFKYKYMIGYISNHKAMFWSSVYFCVHFESLKKKINFQVNNSINSSTMKVKAIVQVDAMSYDMITTSCNFYNYF